MKKYIITISDDLDIFESIEQAEKYLEPWILDPVHKFRAYDEQGNVLTASVVSNKTVKLTPSCKKNIELLKSEIIGYVARLTTTSVISFESASLDELVDYLIKNRGLTK
jgi:hypothetical protein